MKSLTAKERVWLARDQISLVETGNKEAAYLFARLGDKLPEKAVMRYQNYQRFFCGSGVDRKPASESAKEEQPKRKYNLKK